MSFRERYLNRKMILEMAPVVVFFVVNFAWNLMAATAALIIATAICVATGWKLDRSVPVFGIIAVILVSLLGGTSLIVTEALFIQLEPTIGSILFGCVLAAGLLLRPSLLERALSGQIQITTRGWHVLTWIWVAIAFCWALANEVARQTLSIDGWVSFKTFSSIGSILLYIVVTRLTVPRYWNGPRPGEEQA